MQKQQWVTIKNVAKQADVTIDTVLKSINGKDEHISEMTRYKVLETIEQLGYVQNTMAKGLKEEFIVKVLSEYLKND